jgi:hypothetical protein
VGDGFNKNHRQLLRGPDPHRLFAGVPFLRGARPSAHLSGEGATSARTTAQRILIDANGMVLTLLDLANRTNPSTPG